MTDLYKYDPQYQRFAEFFGLEDHERRDYRLAVKINNIYEWANHETKSDELLDIINKVNDLRKEMGVSFTGKTLLNEMNMMVRLKMDSQRKDIIEQVVEENEAEKPKSKLEMDKEKIDKMKWNDKRKESKNIKYVDEYNKESRKESRKQDRAIKPRDIKVEIIEN